jgi:hypothetical protein
MVPAADLGRHRGSDVIVDTTSLIGAEDYILSQNQRVEPADPFARQCFVEVVQSIILMSGVYVIHPTLRLPQANDFGEKPYLLQALLKRGLVHPLQVGEGQWSKAQRLEKSAIAKLESHNGLSSVLRFIEQAEICDQINAHSRPLSEQLRKWSEFQEVNVRAALGHHGSRIEARDGIEDDAYGEWARATAVVLRGTLSKIASPDAEAYLMATLVRGIKYNSRAQASKKFYQSHPMRRDFSLTFELTNDGATSDLTLDVVKVVRGIHESLSEAGNDAQSHRLQLLKVELPLLGGRLWRPAETGVQSEARWMDRIVDRLFDYREKARDLRHFIEHCVTEEDRLRLSRDIEQVKRQLLERLAFRPVELSPVERDLVENVASVTQAVPGFPKVSGLWLGARTVGKRFGFTGNPFQRFLYREFLDAWRRTGQ